MSDASAAQKKPEHPAASRWALRFTKQRNMRRVLYALSSLAVTGIYFFGWRVLAVLAVCTAVGLAAEWYMTSRRGAPVSTACFVTCWLYALSLPPTVPFWIAAVGAVVGIVFGKEVFGGFGRNFANPAILGRAFVYVCFPTALTARFVPAFKAFPAGFAEWSGLTSLPGYLASTGKTAAEAISQASPLYVNKVVGPSANPQGASLWNLFLGSIGGTYQSVGGTQILTAGSIGEGCALLILLAGAYLLLTKTASWRLMLSGFAGLIVTNVLFRNVLGFDHWQAGSPDVPPLLFTLLGGTTVYVLVFMVTDPVSAPKRKGAMYAYGALIGFFIVVLRWRGVFVAAASFAILLGNLIGPLLDMVAAWWARRKRPAPAASEKQGKPT